jgi:serine carboxypeptidase-like clade 2
MSDEVYANVTKNCNFGSAFETPSSEAACDGALETFVVGDIDYYNIYAPVCLTMPNGTYYPSGYVRPQLLSFSLLSSNRQRFSSELLNTFFLFKLQLPGYDPCSDYATYGYLNDPAVQNAFHARATQWKPCT